MLGNVSPTPYDLNFSLFGIPVRVHPLFWVFMALLGWHAGTPKLVFLWVLCAFISVLIHELGHALTAKSFGSQPQIVLYAFGGYAAHQPLWGRSTGRTILILIAGPGAGFVFFALLFAFKLLLAYQGVRLTSTAQDVFWFLAEINIGWGVFNLLPVYPLDGGQISYAALGHWFPRSGEDTSLKISLLIAGGLAALGLWAGQTFLALFFGSMAFENLQMLQRPRYW